MLFLAGFVDSIAGGGGLIALPATMIAGLPVHYAIGTNKFSSILGCSVATYKYHRQGFIPWKQAVWAIVATVIGSVIGANIALMISDHFFKIIMLVVLPLTALYLFRGRAFKEDDIEIDHAKQSVIIVIVSFVIGIYNSFYGPGSGSFLILALTGLAHMKLTSANGITKAINISTDITSVIIFLINGKVMIMLGIVAGIFCMAGSYIGSSLFTKGTSKIVKPIMIAVISVFFIKVVLELTGITG